MSLTLAIPMGEAASEDVAMTDELCLRRLGCLHTAAKYLYWLQNLMEKLKALSRALVFQGKLED